MLYDRLFNVSVGKGGQAGVAFSDIRCEFRVVKSSDSTANAIEFKVYNLSGATRTKFESLDNRVVLSAGYASTGIQVLAVGDILKASTDYPSPEIVTTVTAGDGAKALRGSRVSLSYEPGVPAKSIVDKIVESLEVDSVDVNFDLSGSFRQGWSYVGRAQDAMDKLAARFGFAWSVQNNTLQITEKKGVTARPSILLTPQTGLIGVPYKVEDTRADSEKNREPPGLMVRCLLNPAILPGDVVQVQSSLVPSGSYRVKQIEHRGDTHGQEWVSEIEVVEHGGAS